MSGQQRDLTFRFLAEPIDVNYGGKVHGGVVMKWIDQVGYAAAVGWSGRYSVTVAVGGIRFVAPVRIGDLVTVSARLVHTGTSSMHFAVEVRARDPGFDQVRTDPPGADQSAAAHQDVRDGFGTDQASDRLCTCLLYTSDAADE